MFTSLFFRSKKSPNIFQTYLPQMVYGAVDGTVTTLAAFVIIGFTPMIAYVFDIGSFELSCLMTALAFIGVGIVKGYLSRTPMILSGLQTLGL